MTSPEKKKSFEEAFKELEKLVVILERGECSLEEALKMYEKGMDLARLCEKKLESAEKKLKVLIRDQRGNLKTDEME